MLRQIVPQQRRVVAIKSHRIWWGIVAGYAVGLLYASVMRSPDVGVSIPWMDTIIHVVLYAGFSWLIARAMCASRRSRPLVVACVAALLYGACCEMVQLYVPYRSGEWLDVAANAVGAVLGCRASILLPS